MLTHMQAPTLFLRRTSFSFIAGAASLFENPTIMRHYRTPPTSQIADGQALASDFLIIGDDMRAALSDYGT
jgi:hypothetical protein